MKYPCIRYISLYSELVPFGIGLIKFRSHNRPFRIFFWFITLALIADWSAYEFQRVGHHNLWIVQVYVLTSTVILLAVFAIWLQQNKKLQSLIWIVNICYIIFWGFSKISFEGMLEPPLYTLNLSNVILLGVSLLMITSKYFSGSEEWRQDSCFWVSFGLMIYCAGNLIPFLLIGAYVRMHTDMAPHLWFIPWCMTTVANCCYSWAFICLGKV
jgi:hypothetical protein